MAPAEGVPPQLDPYAPPTADVNHDAQLAGAPPLASRWRRLFAAILDGLLAGLTTIPALVGQGGIVQLGVNVGRAPLRLDDTTTLGLISTICYGAFWILQSFLIATRGQSLGKMALGTRIVSSDGQPASFARVVVLRTWVVLALPFVPVLGSLAALVDVLFIFVPGKRCLHDLVSGTKVIRIEE